MISVHTSIANDRRHYSAARHRSFLEHNLEGDFAVRTGRRFTEELRTFVNGRLPQGWRLYAHEDDADAINPRWVLRWRKYAGDRLVVQDFVFRWSADWRDGRMTADARYRVDSHVKYDKVTVSKRRKGT